MQIFWSVYENFACRQKNSWVLSSTLKTALCWHKRSWVDIASGGTYVNLKTWAIYCRNKAQSSMTLKNAWQNCLPTSKKSTLTRTPLLKSKTTILQMTKNTYEVGNSYYRHSLFINSTTFPTCFFMFEYFCAAIIDDKNLWYEYENVNNTIGISTTYFLY